jgi:hypothetical protein
MFWDMNSKNMDKFAQNEGLKKFEGRRDEKLKKYTLRQGTGFLITGVQQGP